MLAWSELHEEGVAGAEGDLGLWSGWGGAEVGHAPAGGDGGDGEDAFHPGEAFADALAGASSEGEVGEARPRCLGLGGEAVGIEAKGVGVEIGPAADHVLAHEEVRAGWDAVWADGD